MGVFTGARNVLVTGAANGIGRSMVAGLLDKGYRVAAVDRDVSALNGLSEQFRHDADSRNLACFPADLITDNIALLVEEIRSQFGEIDALVNNAGIGVGQFRPDYHTNPPAFWDVPVDQWRKAIDLNASAPFFLCHALVPAMMKRGWGRIVNVTTSLGTMLRHGTAPYGPSKAATESLSAIMAEDLKGSGITVNIIIPGGTTNTPMVPTTAPFHRNELIQPEVMVPPLLWLLSNEAGCITNRRFLAKDWDTSIPAAEASQKISAPIGWPSVAALPVAPKIQA